MSQRLRLIAECVAHYCRSYLQGVFTCFRSPLQLKCINHAVLLNPYLALGSGSKVYSVVALHIDACVRLRNLEPGLRPGVRLAVVKRQRCIKSSRCRSRIDASRRAWRRCWVSRPCLNCGWSEPRLIVSGRRAPWKRQVLQPNAAGFLHRSRLRLDRAVHCAVRPDATLGRGTFVPFD